MAPEVKSTASSFQKLIGVGNSLLGRGFNPSKCKTEVKLAMARIKLLRNKRDAHVKQMRRDLAMLLRSGQESTARIRVEHVIREENIMAANEIIELFCELVVVRLPIITKQRHCPADLKEGISSLIFAAPRCSEIPELLRLNDIFEKKYGRDFVSAATDLRPDAGVNQTLIERLSVRTPPGEVKLKIMREIAKEHQVDWDVVETEHELLKPSEEPLNGPKSFVSAATEPVKSTHTLQNDAPSCPDWRSPNDQEENETHFKDTVSAAQAAADLAHKAIAMAQAAASLAKCASHPVGKEDSFGIIYNDHENVSSRKKDDVSRSPSKNHFESSEFSDHSNMPRNCNPESFARVSDEEDVSARLDGKKNYRRHYGNSDIKFDDSDGLDSDSDEELEMYTGQEGTHQPASKVAPQSPSHVCRCHEKRCADKTGTCKPDMSSRVHPKLPDYDALSAHFETLKSRSTCRLPEKVNGYDERDLEYYEN